MSVHPNTEQRKKKVFRWRQEKQCHNCPFANAGPGLALRKSLRKPRWREIISAILQGDVFWCHKTTYDDQDDDDHYSPRGKELVCAGALAYQEKRGVSSNYQRLCEQISSVEVRS